MADPFNITGRIQQLFKNYSLDIIRDKKGNITEIKIKSNDDMRVIDSIERLWKKLSNHYFDDNLTVYPTLEDVQRICQRMVRRKDKCMDIIKALDGFVANPNPNS